MKSFSIKSEKIIYIAVIFSSILLFLIIVLGSFNYFALNKNFYYSEYEKNDIYSLLSENKTYAKQYSENITSGLIFYLKGDDSSSDISYFSIEEQSHISDVKNVLKILRVIYYASILLFAALFFYLYTALRHENMLFISYVSLSTFWAGILSLAFIILLTLLLVFQFDFLFTLMHLILFPQGNWTFTESSLLIKLFSETFFFDMGLRIFIYAIFQGAIFLWIGVWLKKQLKIRKEFKKN